MTRFRWLVALFLVFTLVATACGDDDAATSTDDSADGSSDGSSDDSSSDDGSSDDSSSDDSSSDDSSSDDSSSDDSSSDDSSDDGAASDIDPDGVLKVATFMDRLDMEINDISAFGTVTHHGILHAIFGMPLRLEADGTYQPWLAESFEVVDASTVTVTLREGLTFHDGTPYNAQALADSILGYQALQSADPPIIAWNSTELANIASIDVDGETGLTFNLSTPTAGLLVVSLAGPMGYAMSPASNPPNEVYGAGPFRLVDFELDDHLTVEKWDDFFDAESYLLGGVEWLNLNKIEAAQNGLEDDIVDLAATNPRDLESLLARGNFEGVVTNNQGHYMLAVCNTKPPFDDPKFREAFDLALNRDRITDTVFGGSNAPMESLWNPGSSLDIPGLIDTDGDVDAAKAILAEIGWDEDTEILLGIYPGFQTHELIAEVVSGTVADAGLNAKVTIMEGYDVPSFSGQGGLHVVANINEGVNAVNAPARGASTAWNPCGYDDPALNALVDTLAAGGSPESLAGTWQELQEYVTSNHLWYVLNTQPAVYAYNSDRVGGVKEGTVGLTGATAPSPFLEGIFMKAS